MKSSVLFPLCLHIVGGVLVFCKANAKRVWGVDLSPFMWWLTVGFLVEYCYLTAWWQLSSTTSPWVAQVSLMGVGAFTSMILMSVFYGFEMKYIIAACCILVGVCIANL